MKLIKIVLLLIGIGSCASINAKAVSQETYKKWTGSMLVLGTDKGDAPIALHNFILIEGAIFYDFKHGIGGQITLQDKIKKNEIVPWDTDLWTSLDKLRNIDIANVISKYLAKNPGKK